MFMPHDYSLTAEKAYFSTSTQDRTALPFEHLDRYFTGSVGLDFFTDKTVLDLGCGEGVFSAWIAARGNARSVVGIDLTEHRIRSAYAHDIPNLRFLAGDIFQLPVVQKFDCLFMNLVLHHVRFGLDRVAEIIASRLNPGGRFLAFEPNFYSPIALAAHHFASRSPNEGFISPKTIKRSLSKHGLKVDYGYFWRDRKWATNPLLASSVWITGQLIRDFAYTPIAR